MELDFDYHNHTALSRCSRKDYTVAEMLARMQDIGLKHVGFCDHYYHDETVVARNIQCVREGAAGFPGLEVYAGVEVDMLWAGHLDASYQTLAPFDYI
ncbi:MAG: PHP domain-containing protein, partial [Clostridia bacterium]